MSDDLREEILRIRARESRYKKEAEAKIAALEAQLSEAGKLQAEMATNVAAGKEKAAKIARLEADLQKTGEKLAEQEKALAECEELRARVIELEERTGNYAALKSYLAMFVEIRMGELKTDLDNIYDICGKQQTLFEKLKGSSTFTPLTSFCLGPLLSIAFTSSLRIMPEKPSTDASSDRDSVCLEQIRANNGIIMSIYNNIRVRLPDLEKVMRQCNAPSPKLENFKHISDTLHSQIISLQSYSEELATPRRDSLFQLNPNGKKLEKLLAIVADIRTLLTSWQNS